MAGVERLVLQLLGGVWLHILIRRPNEPLPRYWGPVYPGPEGKTNDGGMYDGSAKVLAFETNDDFTYIASDATKLYGKKCTEAVRQFVHLLFRPASRSA